MQPENLDRVQAWHNTLDPHHRVAWASPSSVLRHCPVFASEKPAKPAGPAMTKPTNDDLARELVAAKAHIAELEATRPDHIEQPAVDLTVARRSYLALVPKPAAEAWAELVTIAKHMGFDLPEPPPRNTTEPHNKELRTKRKKAAVTAQATAPGPHRAAAAMVAMPPKYRGPSQGFAELLEDVVEEVADGVADAAQAEEAVAAGVGEGERVVDDG